MIYQLSVDSNDDIGTLWKERFHLLLHLSVSTLAKLQKDKDFISITVAVLAHSYSV